MNNNEKEGLRWYLQGERDSRTAGKNVENGDFEVGCFLYQQAAEKMLKGYLYLQGERSVLGHSTLKLAGRCMAYDRRFREVLDFCRELDLFYIPTRYPNGIPEGMPYEYFHHGHAASAGKACEAVRELVGESFRSLEEEQG